LPAGFGIVAKLFESELHVVHMLRSACRVLAEAAPDDFFEIARNAVEWFRLVPYDGGEHGDRRVTAEWPASAHHFVEE